jgi:hypothetical protein
MLNVIGQILPEALAIAYNPLAICVVIILLINQRGIKKAALYLLGWVIGLAALILAIYLLMDLSRGTRWQAPPNLAVLQILTGLIFAGLAVYEFRLMSRKKDSPPASLDWVDKLDIFTPLNIFILAFSMATLNLKNAALILSASTSIMGANLQRSSSWIVVAIFIILGSITTIVPVANQYINGQQAEAQMRGWLDWVMTNYPLVLCIVFIFFAAKLIGAGIAGL